MQKEATGNSLAAAAAAESLVEKNAIVSFGQYANCLMYCIKRYLTADDLSALFLVQTLQSHNPATFSS